MSFPFACLHGFAGGPDDFLRLDLPRVHAPWLTGHGPTPDCSALSYEEEIERQAAQLRQLGCAVHVVGYSMGARLALGLALAHPGLVARLSLIGVNPGLMSESERCERRAWEQSWIHLLQTEGVRAFERKWSQLPLFSSQRQLPETVLRRQRASRENHTAAGLSHALSVLGLAAMPNLWAKLSRLGMKTELVVGALDEKFRNIALEMADRVPSLRVFALPGIGHNPLIEAPQVIRGRLLAND